MAEMRNEEATQILVTFNGVYKFGVVINVLNRLQFYIIHNFVSGKIATRCPTNYSLSFPLHDNTLTYTNLETSLCNPVICHRIDETHPQSFTKHICKSHHKNYEYGRLKPPDYTPALLT
jgi:hypothetical protein